MLLIRIKIQKDTTNKTKHSLFTLVGTHMLDYTLVGTILT